MSDWENAKARLSVGFMGHVPGGSCEAEKPCLGCDVRSALEEVEDARSYAAEIAQGVSHYPHEEAEPCVRCRAERAEAEVARLQGSIASYQAAAHNYVNEHAEVARLKALMAERQEWRSRMGLSTQDEIVKRAEKAEAEVERLREALSLIGRWNRNTCREESALEFARTALQGGGE